jgi:hypothetical protein
MTCLKNGAYVHLVDYQRWAPADIYLVGETYIVRFNDNVLDWCQYKPFKPATHALYLNRHDNFWRDDLGIAVVNFEDLVQLQSEELENDH